MDRINFWSVFIGIGVIGFIILIYCCDDCSISSCYSPFALFLRLFLVGALFIGGTFYYSRKWATMNSILFAVERLPLISIAMCTSEVPTQISGKVIPQEKTLYSPATETECVFYHYIKERYERSGDSSSWVVIQNSSMHVPFKVQDSTGEILVDVTNVDSDLGTYKLDKYSYKGKKEPFLVDYANSEVDAIKMIYQRKVTNDIRESEYVLVPNMDVFVNGWVYSFDGEKVIGEHELTPLIISRKSKEEYLEDFAKGDNFFYSSSFLLLFGGVSILFAFSIYFALPLEIVLIVPFIVFARIIYATYNRMVELLVRCSNARSQIDIELKKRTELIPTIELLLKAHSKYEKALLEFIVFIRSDAANFTNDSPEKLFAIIEKYPEIKSQNLFKEFILQLKTIEDNIAYYRGFHNKTVMKYNTLISLFPFVILAIIFGFKQKELLIMGAS